MKEMQSIIEKLQSKQTRDSTAKNYLNIWHQFNKFLLRLDKRPSSWEHRTLLFVAHLIEYRGAQSSTVKSYVSAIKKTLTMDKHKWNDNVILISSLTKASKIINDLV